MDMNDKQTMENDLTFTIPIYSNQNYRSQFTTNLCTTTTFETPNFWPLLTGGRYSEVVISPGLTTLGNDIQTCYDNKRSTDLSCREKG